jgi:hypothetical protein
MSKVNSLLAERMKKPKQPTKMTALGNESSRGNLNTFSGVFQVTDLSPVEKEEIQQLLLRFSDDDQEMSEDLHQLIAITSEVKAITNQAALLHGERIKRAQEILKTYKEGAFTAWLISTYGNRQTPYNFLQYYEFYHALPKALHSHLEQIPRQAIYTLASREGEIEKKHELIKQFSGQTKEEFLALIREMFPLGNKDGRKQKVGEKAISSLSKLHDLLNKKNTKIAVKERREIEQLLNEIMKLLN